MKIRISPATMVNRMLRMIACFMVLAVTAPDCMARVGPRRFSLSVPLRRRHSHWLGSIKSVIGWRLEKPVVLSIKKTDPQRTLNYFL